MEARSASDGTCGSNLAARRGILPTFVGWFSPRHPGMTLRLFGFRRGLYNTGVPLTLGEMP